MNAKKTLKSVKHPQKPLNVVPSLKLWLENRSHHNEMSVEYFIVKVSYSPVVRWITFEKSP